MKIPLQIKASPQREALQVDAFPVDDLERLNQLNQEYMAMGEVFENQTLFQNQGNNRREPQVDGFLGNESENDLEEENSLLEQLAQMNQEYYD